MANILITPCDGGSPIIVNDGSNTIVTGSTYFFTFTGLTSEGCFSVDSISVGVGVDGIDSISSEYNNCLECYQQNGWSYMVSACSNPQLGGPVGSFQFTETPSFGSYYQLCANQGEFEGCLCFEITGVTNNIYPYNFGITGPFLDCSCSISANTEENICIEVCTPSGNTVVSVTTPHPIWTNNQGSAVYQMNAITLGGPNGLNN